MGKRYWRWGLHVAVFGTVTDDRINFLSYCKSVYDDDI